LGRLLAPFWRGNQRPEIRYAMATQAAVQAGALYVGMDKFLDDGE
jgi:hypothetical protein